jgi:hypothetical protein
MNAPELIDRLKSQCPALKHVAGAADFATAEKLVRHQLPAAFVIPLVEEATPNAYATMAVSQRVTQRFGVILAVSNLRDLGGEAAINDLTNLRPSVLTALLGWQPDAGSDLVEFAGGRLLTLSEQVLWWQDDYRSAITIRK